MKLTTLITTCLLLSGSLLIGKDGNLLRNSDFSSVDRKQNLYEWRLEHAGYTRTAVDGVQEIALKPIFKFGKHYVAVSQGLNKLPAGAYRFTGEIQGNVKVAYLVVGMPAGHKPVNTLCTVNFPAECKKWTPFSCTFTMPAGHVRSGLNFQPVAHGANDVIKMRKFSLVRTGDAPAAAPVVKKAAPAAKKAAVTAAPAVPAVPVKITGNLVARPAAASNVKWPVHLFCGKDYWFMLEPVWRTMKGLSHEKFIQEAGVRGIGTPWKAVAPYRRTGLQEIEVWQGGKNVTPQCKFQFIAEERGTQFFYISSSTDGNMKTSGWICGETKDFRYINTGVPFRVRITLPTAAPVEKIVFRTNPGSLPVRDGALYVAKSDKKIDNAVISKGNVLTVQNLNAPGEKEIYFKGVTQHTVYTAENDLSPANKKLVANRPFTSPLYQGPLKFKGIGEFKMENVDRDSIRRFRAKYPNFIPEQQLEISANFFQRRVHKSKEAWADNSVIVPPYDRNRYEAAETLRKYFTYYYDLFGGITILEGGLWTMPYYYEWGAEMTFPEAFNESARYSSNRHLLTFSRGGARQYGKAFGFYQTVFGEATSANSLYSQEEARRLAKLKKNPWHVGEDFGVSPTYHKRLLMLAYYAGTSFQQFESEPGGYAKRLKDNTWILTGNGKSLKTVYDWVSRPEAKRGTYYAPILLLNDYFSGNWEWRQSKTDSWKVWYMYPYEDGDYMIRHLLNQLDPPVGDWKRMQELSNGMRNSELADLYDVYFANAPSGAVTPEEMGKYPVVFLTGQISKVDGLSENLQQYVREGGTLVLNSAQLNLIPEKFAGIRSTKQHVVSDNMKILKVIPEGAEVLAKDSTGLPLLTRYKNGKGHVILATPHHMLNISNKKESIPLLRALMLQLQKEVLPVSVKGDILFCFNKMSGNDWKLILINNKGTYKDTRETNEKIFPEYAKKVTFTLPKGATAKELRLNLPIRVKNGQAEITVPSGDVAVVELKNIPFSDSPINAKVFNRKPSDPNKRDPSRNPAILIDSKLGDGGLHYNTQKRDGALYLPGKESGVIFNSPALPQLPMPEGGYCCFAKPEIADPNAPLQTVISNEYTRIDIVRGHWQLFFYDLKQLQHLRGPKVVPGKWTHVAFTWKNNQARMFIDGKEIMPPNGPMLFGGRCDGANSFYHRFINLYIGTFHLWRRNLFKGYVRDIKLFGVAPSEEQIKKMAEGKN